MKLVNADGSDLAPLGTLVMKVSVGGIQTDHIFTIVEHLLVPVILGCDFFTRHGIVIDFDCCTFSCSQNPKACMWKAVLQIPVCWWSTMISHRPYPLRPNVRNTPWYPLTTIPCMQQSSRNREPSSGRSLDIATNVTGGALPIVVSPHAIPFNFNKSVHTHAAGNGRWWNNSMQWLIPRVANFIMERYIATLVYSYCTLT